MSKAFVLDRSGQTPQLLNQQDEKIPIYDSVADAQADIASLEEGQIGMTEDSGATEKVVDVVQDGNMNPVTSNAVFDALRKTHFKTYTVNAQNIDANGNAYTPLDAKQVLPISFVPKARGDGILVWQFARYNNQIYLRVNRTTGDTLTGTIYYVDL